MTGTAHLDHATPAEAARLVAQVQGAAAFLPAVWPLETFIAVNPLSGLEHLPFEEAGERSRELFGAAGALDEAAYRRLHAEGRIPTESVAAAAADRLGARAGAPVAAGPDGREVTATDVVVADLLHGEPVPEAPVPTRTLAEAADRSPGTTIGPAVDDEAARWAARFVDDGGVTWGVPDRETGLFASWLTGAAIDRRRPAAVRDRLGRCSSDATTALLAGTAWCPSDEVRTRFLRGHLAARPGWAAYLRSRGDGLLLGYLAVRVVLERALVDAAGVLEEAMAAMGGAADDRSAAPAPDPAARLRAALGSLGVDPADLDEAGAASATAALNAVPAAARPWMWLEAHERTYRSALLDALPAGTASGTGHVSRHAAVFCIDPRSEGLRRHLEGDGAVETYGFAGFFAVPMAYRDVAGGEASPQCPVLLEPRVTVDERAGRGAVEEVARSLRGRRLEAGGSDGFHAAKDDFLGPFALAEASGWVAGPASFARTLAPGAAGGLRGGLRRLVAPPAETELLPEPSLAFEEQVLFAQVLLASTGLHRTPARVALLCGHGSTTENNPYASALDCGACGGHRGAPNARIAAAVLNRADVRSALAERGIEVHEDTWFVAGEHDTATDRVSLLDTHLVPDTHRADVDDLAGRLEAAGRDLALERSATLPGMRRRGDRLRSVRRRSVDWAQVLPEWGLAGNAAFVVGPRSTTAGVDLGRRTFLHSYDAAADSGGDALETILTAPMVVAQWINCQYYFSSVAPGVFGAGTKTVHNVVGGGIGVLAGAEGDLRLGLPWQSVGWGDRLVHEPLRLLVVVEAPRDRIDDVIGRNAVLRKLFGNGWVAMVARGSHDAPWEARARDGSWSPWVGVGTTATDGKIEGDAPGAGGRHGRKDTP